MKTLDTRLRRCGVAALVAVVAALAAGAPAMAVGGTQTGTTITTAPSTIADDQSGTTVNTTGSGGLTVYEAATEPSSTTTPTQTSVGSPPSGCPWSYSSYELYSGQVPPQTVTGTVSTEVQTDSDGEWSVGVDASGPWFAAIGEPQVEAQEMADYLSDVLHSASFNPGTEGLVVTAYGTESVSWSGDAASPCLFGPLAWDGYYRYTIVSQRPPAGRQTPPSAAGVQDNLETDLGISQDLGAPEASPANASYVFVPTCYWINNPAPVLLEPQSETEYIPVAATGSIEYIFFYQLTATDPGGVVWTFSDGSTATGTGQPSVGGCTSSVQHVYKQVSQKAVVNASTTVSFSMQWGYTWNGGPDCPLGGTNQGGVCYMTPPPAPASLTVNAANGWTVAQPVDQVEGELGS